MINFEYQNPTRIIFGQGAVKKLSGEILKHGKRVLGRGKAAPWMAGPLGNIIEEKAGLDYTTGIAITFPKYMKVCCKDCLPLFVQFAINVMNINPEGKFDNQIAREGADGLQKLFDHLGLAH